MAGDFCLNEQQCLMGNRQSKCKYIIPRIYGKCRCLEGFHQTKDNRCLPSKFHSLNEKQMNNLFFCVTKSHFIIRFTKLM